MIKKIEPYKGIAGIYDEIRPSYPEKLIQDIITKTKLKLNDSLLEIGAGPGKATMQFASRGFGVHAIEIGEEMAKILKDKCVSYPKVSVDIVSFEEWNYPVNQRYDMIYSAQAFHWIDKNIKYKKCYELLKSNGYLILFWYNACNDKLTKTNELEEKIEAIVEKYTSNYNLNNRKTKRLTPSGASSENERKAEIEASGLFEIIEEIEYVQEIRNNAKQYLMAIKSVPAFASILDGLSDRIIENMDNEIEEVINNNGGYISTLFNYSLYITKKSASFRMN